MGKIWGKLKQDKNFTLVILIFVVVATAATTYLIVGKPAISKINIAVAGFSFCALTALVFLARSVLTRKSAQQETPKGCYLGHEEPFGC